MKLFIDTADLGDIREASAMGILDGVTTNPSLIAKAGRSRRELLLQICELVQGPVSGEVLATDHAAMLDEARGLAALAPNIVVKIPLTAEGLRAVKTLTEEGIETNVTLCFSPVQALLAAKAGAAYVSPFVGRLDDVGHDGMQIAGDILDAFGRYELDTQVLVASVRSPRHVLEAMRMGADVATMPISVLRQLVAHPLTEAGLERFLRDARSTPRDA